MSMAPLKRRILLIPSNNALLPASFVFANSQQLLVTPYPACTPPCPQSAANRPRRAQMKVHTGHAFPPRGHLFFCAAHAFLPSVHLSQLCAHAFRVNVHFFLSGVHLSRPSVLFFLPGVPLSCPTGHLFLTAAHPVPTSFMPKIRGGLKYSAFQPITKATS